MSNFSIRHIFAIAVYLVVFSAVANYSDKSKCSIPSMAVQESSPCYPKYDSIERVLSEVTK